MIDLHDLDIGYSETHEWRYHTHDGIGATLLSELCVQSTYSTAIEYLKHMGWVTMAPYYSGHDRDMTKGAWSIRVFIDPVDTGPYTDVVWMFWRGDNENKGLPISTGKSYYTVAQCLENQYNDSLIKEGCMEYV